jgi:hypothetical protein
MNAGVGTTFLPTIQIDLSFEVLLAAWRVHATAFELHQNSGDRDSVERHLTLSRETVMKLANSLPTEEPLRRTYLSAPVVRKILGNNVGKSTVRSKEKKRAPELAD